MERKYLRKASSFMTQTSKIQEKSKKFPRLVKLITRILK